MTLSTTSWMVPLALPSWDMERRRVSMAWWLEHPNNDSPFTATSWSLMHKRPSCERTVKLDYAIAATCGFGTCASGGEHIVRTTSGALCLTPLLPSLPMETGSGLLWLQDMWEFTSIKASVSFPFTFTFYCTHLCSCLIIFCHLVRSPSVDNGFDEDPQVLPRLPGLVSFEADAQPRGAAVIKRHLKRELLLSILRHKDRHAGHLVLLGVGETVMGVEEENEMLMRKRGSRTQLTGLIWPPGTKQKSFSI